MTFQYVCFIIFAFLAYLIITDASVARFVFLLGYIVKFQYDKIKWWVWNNPRTPWASYLIHRRSIRLAEELMKEVQDKSK